MNTKGSNTNGTILNTYGSNTNGSNINGPPPTSLLSQKRNYDNVLHGSYNTSKTIIKTCTVKTETSIGPTTFSICDKNVDTPGIDLT